MDLIKTVQHVIAASSFALFYRKLSTNTTISFLFDKVMKVFVNPNTKINHISLIIPTNGIGLIIKDHCVLAAVMMYKKMAKKHCIYT